MKEYMWRCQLCDCEINENEHTSYYRWHTVCLDHLEIYQKLAWLSTGRVTDIGTPEEFLEFLRTANKRASVRP